MGIKRCADLLSSKINDVRQAAQTRMTSNKRNVEGFEADLQRLHHGVVVSCVVRHDGNHLRDGKHGKRM
jgi:hypothetical protein